MKMSNDIFMVIYLLFSRAPKGSAATARAGSCVGA
jgi:hypothetical protein